jgi:hypothetical protein
MTSSASKAPDRRRYAETPMQKAALIVGVVFLVVGVAGFVPGLTSDVGDLHGAGHGSGAMLLGLFQVSVLHNIVHLLFGIAGVALARTFRASKLYLIVGGLVYAVLWIYGLVIDKDSQANFVPLNTADDWLHFVLAVGMIGLGVLLGRRRAPRRV